MFDVDAESFNFQVINVGSQPCVFFGRPLLVSSRMRGDRASSVQNVVQCVHPAVVSHVRQSSVFPVFTLSFLVKLFVGYLLRLFLMVYLSNLQLKQPMLSL